MTYDDAVAELYRAPHAEFVAARKRLAGELKAAGDKAGSTRLGKAGRPNISAWVVNQLYWHARDAFDHMLETAARIRGGDLSASAEHREAIAALRARAAKLLDEAGHGATEATLRRVTTTLSALAVAGGFDPDPPGALADDRDPPGFDAIMGGVVPAAPVEIDSPGAAGARSDAERRGVSIDSPGAAGARSDAERRGVSIDEPAREARARKKAEDEHAARERDEAQARRKAEEAARAKAASDRNRLETALRTAKADAVIRARNVEVIREQLQEAERLAAKAQAAADEIQAELDEVVKV